VYAESSHLPPVSVSTQKRRDCDDLCLHNPVGVVWRVDLLCDVPLHVMASNWERLNDCQMGTWLQASGMGTSKWNG